MVCDKITKYNIEMAEHANGAAQYLEALLGGRFVTREQTRDMVDYLWYKTQYRELPFCNTRTEGCRDTSKGIVVECIKAAYGAIVLDC